MELDWNIFAWNLAETIKWCDTNRGAQDPRTGFRTPVLRPTPWREGPEWPAGLSDLVSLADRKSVVEDVVKRRRTLLLAKGSSPDRSAADLHGGHLLLYNPDDSLWDGAAEMASYGFFDDDNTPPWDTWLLYVIEDRGAIVNLRPGYLPWKSYLVSWVPSDLLEAVDAAILSNPEECIIWARNLDSIFTTELGRRGLL